METLVTKKLKVSIVSMNLSTNCTNRCYRIAQALRPQYDVEIVGTTFGVGQQWGQGIWPPLTDCEIPIKSVRGEYFPAYIRSLKQLFDAMDGDIIVACKPRFSSFGIALIKRLISGTPVILDVDDDELAQTMPGKKATLIRQLINPTGWLYTRLTHLFHRKAAAVFTVSEFFRHIYGGVIVPHGRDPKELDPSRYDQYEIRKTLGIPKDEICILFLGTPQYQKGIDLILTALTRIGNPHLKLTVVGADVNDEYTNALSAEYGNLMRVIPPQPLSRMPHYLAAADIVALPQRLVPEGLGQMPAKLTDAMAMGKTIIASDIADIAKYLEGRGLVIAPDSADDLTEKIRWVLNHKSEAQYLGQKAREYYLEHLSLDSMLRAMKPEIQRVSDATSTLLKSAY